MEYEIVGGQLPVVVCKLNQHEKMITESGGMCWMDDFLRGLVERWQGNPCS